MKTFLSAVLAATSLASDAYKSMGQLCMQNGFDLQSYTLVTDDGYVLSLYRIPGTLQEIANPPTEQKPAVLMMHCQDCDMMEWVVNSPEVAPAFVLANEGYDVWMGNNRGSKYSNTHVTMSKDDKDYWDFYQEEMALQDLPTFIDYILGKTGLDNISYVGHSEGTTQMFMGASLMPEYFKERINVYLALAPVASTANIPTPIIRKAAHFIREI